jgi:hypothetical protein
MDVRTLTQRELHAFEEYLDETEHDYIDYYPTRKLTFSQWREREDPCDPDVDA